MRKTVSIILFVAFGVLAFLTPLLFGSPTHEVYELPKMLFVYFVGGTILWFFLVFGARGKKRILPSREILSFVLFYALSTALSAHLYTSAWGYYKRFNGGLVSVLIFVGLYWVLINSFRREQIRAVINYMALAAIPVSTYAIYQHYFVDGVVRAYSTFGQANWLAAFLAVTGIIALGAVVEAKTRGEEVFWAAAFVVGFCGMWVSYSISGFLGFLAGATYFIALNKNAVRGKFKSFFVMGVVVCVFALANQGIFADKIRDIFIDIKKVYAQDELVENAVSDPGFIRSELWAGTLRLFVSSSKVILFGTGPETFPYVFQPFRPDTLNYSSEWDFVFNKPHNYYLELLSGIGVFGTLAYFAIVKKSLARQSAHAPALLAFYVTNIFGWPTVATALFFWLALAEQEARE